MKYSISKYKPTGSKKSVPLTREQFDYILAEFHDDGDTRMEVLCHLLFRAIRIGDCLRTLKVHHLYNPDGSLKDKIHFIEEKTKKERFVPIAGEKFTVALTRHWIFAQQLQPTDGLFWNQCGEPLQDSGVKRQLLKFVGQRGIRQCSPHSFRKGGARYMFDNGVRIEHICDVLNHHSTRTTEIYIDITPRDVEMSMECLAI